MSIIMSQQKGNTFVYQSVRKTWAGQFYHFIRPAFFTNAGSFVFNHLTEQQHAD